MLDSGTSNNYINDAAVVSLTNTAVVNLAFTGLDMVANLYINSVQAGWHLGRHRFRSHLY